MIIDDLDKVIAYLYDCKPDMRSYLTIHNDVFKNDMKVPVKEIISHLGENITAYEMTGGDIPVDMQIRYAISVQGIIFFERLDFFRSRRPYKRMQGIERSKIIWRVAKIIMAILNALAILYLMYRQTKN